MRLGEISEYIVERETKLGYMISQDGVEYFLHHNECMGRRLNFNEKIKAFLYVDKMKRVAATLANPIITLNKFNFCKVVNTNSAGAFVNIGISRDILLSSDDFEINNIPQIGDTLCCTLKCRGQNLFIKLANKKDILSLKNDIKLNIGEKYKGYVYRITEEGINVVLESFNIVFVYYKNLKRKYRIGEEVEVKIIKDNDSDYNGTLIEQKELEIINDAQKVLNFLNDCNGVMIFTSNTSPEIIMKNFNMSKASFKRALGKLYKDRKIILEDDKTILVK